MFRHFGSKDELFRQAVYAPLQTFFTDYTALWRASLEAGGPPPGSTDYMSRLYDVLREHRELLTTLLAADAHRANAFGTGSTDSPLAELLREVEELVTRELGRNVRTSLDPALAVRFAFAMGLSMALFGDLMFPADRPRPDHDKLVEGMGDFLSFATRRATESVAPPRRR